MPFIYILCHAHETDVQGDFLRTFRLPGRKCPEIVARNSLSAKGCKESSLIARALPPGITHVITNTPPHTVLETGRSASPFLTIYPFIKTHNILHVEEKDSLLHFPTLMYTKEHSSIVICSTLRDI